MDKGHINKLSNERYEQLTFNIYVRHRWDLRPKLRDFSLSVSFLR